MSDSETETDKLVCPSAKVGSITRIKNKITKTVENQPIQDTETLVAWKEKLTEEIKSFEDACNVETAKNVSEEETAKFKKWYKKHRTSNDLFMNKLERLIIENDADGSSSDEEELDENEKIGRRKKKEEEEEGDGKEKEWEENPENSLIQCLLQASAQLPQRTPEKFDGSDVT